MMLSQIQSEAVVQKCIVPASECSEHILWRMHIRLQLNFRKNGNLKADLKGKSSDQEHKL